MSDFDDRLRRASRIYERLLWLYPRGHRDEFGPLMTQFFRDQCRATSLESPRSLLELWLGTVADVALSASREHLSHQLHAMKSMPRNTLSLSLFVMSIGAAILSVCLVPGQINLALGLAYFSALALLLRAIVEWRRPSNELVRSLTWEAMIAVIFAFIIPIWAKLHLPIIAGLVITPMFLNAFVPMIKTGRHLASRRP